MAPNPIDFDVVILAFSQLDQTKNFSVIIFTAVLFLLYLIILVWCRRADKKDKAKVNIIQIIPFTVEFPAPY